MHSNLIKFFLQVNMPSNLIKFLLQVNMHSTLIKFFLQVNVPIARVTVRNTSVVG